MEKIITKLLTIVILMLCTCGIANYVFHYKPSGFELFLLYEIIVIHLRVKEEIE